MNEETVQDQPEMKLFIGTKIIKARPGKRGYTPEELSKMDDDCDSLDTREMGYEVVYPDVDGNFDKTSHRSWSPKDVFEAAYHQCDAMPFGMAIEAMKMGHRVARAGWNGKGMFVYLVKGSNVAKENLRNEAKTQVSPIVMDGASVDICPHIDMKAADGTIVVGWLASQTDMLSEDWHFEI